MKSLDLGCGVGSGSNSEDVFYVSATLIKKYCRELWLYVETQLRSIGNPI